MINIKAHIDQKLIYTNGYVDGINFEAKNVLTFLKDKDSDVETRLSNAIMWCEGSIKINKDNKDNNIKNEKENT